MFKCKDCGQPMERVYMFTTNGEQYQTMKCPMCGGQTKLRPIEYDDKGNLVNRHSKPKKKKRKKVEQ